VVPISETLTGTSGLHELLSTVVDVPNTPSLRSALWLPLFDELADPIVVRRTAAEAEEAGWHGLFVWDHVHWRAPIREVADPWITLSAVATATASLLLGPMVTPLARRRPTKVARETATLDRLTGGRLVLGIGLGSDRFGREFSATGDELDDRHRAAMLDESLQVLDAAWSGRPVHHLGAHYIVDDLTFLPRPTRPIPVWVAGFPGRTRPLQRAAAHDGYVPINLEHPEQLAQAVATITGLRGDCATPYDVAVPLPAGTDVAGFVRAGATWWLTDFDPEKVSVDEVRGVLRDGPA
jgi:alkanesulfonate monooxygenase SsuD/methylene tetrahydromethanopterin reductase-like flavin-dependent oxidoreductase (luciferase family)